jgi:hypothetical protein
MNRTLRPLAALAMLAVIIAGCSNGSAGNGNTRTTSSSGTANSSGSSSTAAGHTSTATPREKAVKYAACMRTNGVPDLPDPKASGDFPAFGVSVRPAVWDKALGACEALKPPGSLSARLSPAQQSAALTFAQCIRENGVKDFPDPANDEPLVDTRKIPSAATPAGMTILNAAIQKCRGFVGG